MKQFIIDICRRTARAVLFRLAEDVELMQTLRACFTSTDFISAKFGGASAVQDRGTLLTMALQRAPTEGLVCEFGVYKGHTLRIIASRLRNVPVYGFDSFNGLPEDWRAGFGKGTFTVAPSDVPKFSDNVKLYPGLFDATIPTMLIDDPRPAAFLHVDCDLYSSTKCIFDLLSSRLKVGTVIVFDEYLNFPGWENGEHRALVEAAMDSSFTYQYLFYNSKGQQVAIAITTVRNL